MYPTSLVNKLRSLRGNTSGNVQMMFALSIIPAFTLVGAAVDYSRAFNYQTYLQSLLDSATTAAAREYANTADRTKAENRLRDVVLAGLAQRTGGAVNFQCWIDASSQEKDYKYMIGLITPTQQQQQATCTTIQPTNIPPDTVVLKGGNFETNSASIDPTLTSAVHTTALGLMGMKFITVSAASTASLTGKKLEVSMMLDTTGSMGSSAGNMTKLSALKLAANDMLTILTSSLNAGNTRIAVVPFAEGVNPGSFNSDVRDTPAASKTFLTRKYNSHTQTYSSATYLKTNCVTERTGSDLFTDNPPSFSKYDTLFNQSGVCAEASTILPLTSTLTVLKNKVNGLVANGSTPGHLGTQWAWNMISPKWASVWGNDSAPAAYDDKGVMKVAILMTDGEYNLQYCQGVDDSKINCSDPNGTSTAQARTFCENMKAQGITVYSIGFQIDVQEARDTLIQCASYSKSDPTKKLYYFPYSSDDIRAAFSDIGNQLKAGQSGVTLGN